MRDHYINVWLFVDDRSNGGKWAKMEEERYHANTQPLLVILDKDGNDLSAPINYQDGCTLLETELLKHH